METEKIVRKLLQLPWQQPAQVQQVCPMPLGGVVHVRLDAVYIPQCPQQFSGPQRICMQGPQFRRGSVTGPALEIGFYGAASSTFSP